MSAAEKSIREELESAMQEQVETPEPETPAPAETAAPVETGAKERVRDEHGRFAAREAADTAGGKQDDAANGVAAKVGADASVQQPAVQAAAAPDAQSGAATAGGALAPPNGWPADAKAKWHELPPEIMAAVQKREQDVAKFTSKSDDERSFGRDVYRAVQPYMAQIQAEGATPVMAIQSLLNTAYVLRTGSPEQKRQVLMQAAQQYGVDLGAKLGTQPAATGLETVQQRLDRLEYERSQERAHAEQRLQAEVQTEIQAFAADPKNQHYEAVKGHMAALIREGLAKDLQDAYDQSVHARPDIRATLEAQRRAEEEQKRRADAKLRAEEAKRKGLSITGGPGNTAQSSAPGGRSIREELESAMAASGGAV